MGVSYKIGGVTSVAVYVFVVHEFVCFLTTTAIINNKKQQTNKGITKESFTITKRVKWNFCVFKRRK